MSAESQEFEYVWDFQVPGYKPETRQKTPRTLDSCKLELISFQPHTFDSIATMMNNRETSPFGLFAMITNSGVGVQTKDLKNLKIATCVHIVMQ
jgi:hypothetical protein